MLTKQTAVVVLLPHLFVLWRAVGWRAAGKVAGVAGALTLAVMAPYVIADPDGVWYMAVTLPGLRDVAFQTTLLAWRVFPPIYNFLAEHSNTLIIVLIAIASLAAVLRGRIRPGGARAYALYALCGLIMLDLEKWGIAHFFVMPVALLVVWELLAGRWPWGGLVLALGVTIMYVLNADVATSLSFSVLIAPLVLMLAGLTVYVGVYLFGGGKREEGR
jgi:uncharacterized membrane protein